jgi:hypothetical protein
VHPATLALDRYGNVIGGVRTPAVDVPISTLSGSAPAGATVICSLFGSTKKFSTQMLVSLYGSRANYLAKYAADLAGAVGGHFVLSADRAALMAQADQVRIP